MAKKLKINTKEVDGKAGYQAVGSDGTTTKWYASERRARSMLGRLRRKKKMEAVRKSVTTRDNETSVDPKLYGDMLERKE